MFPGEAFGKKKNPYFCKVYGQTIYIRINLYGRKCN